jgi:transposase
MISKMVQEFLAKKRDQTPLPPPYSPDLAPADFLFPKLKKELAGHTMNQEEFKKEWEGSSGESAKTTSPRPL